MEWLQRWWCQKFNRPRKDPLLQQYTLEELFIEYMEDAIEKDPLAAYPPGQEDAPRVTGDKLIDSWEREIADGRTPDFAGDLGTDAEVDKALQAWLKPKKDGGGGGQPPPSSIAQPRAVPLMKAGVPTEPPNFEGEELEFHDDFTGG